MRLQLYILILLILTLGEVFPQSTNIATFLNNDLKKADMYFNNRWYEGAVELYQRELEKNPDHLHAKLRIAESFYLLKDHENAEKWYREVIAQIETSGDIEPRHFYNFAESLTSNKKYEEAELWLNRYAELEPSDSRIFRKVDFFFNRDYFQRDSALYDITLLPLNSEYSDFGVQYFDSGFVFLSSRDRDLFVKHSASYSMSEEESLLDLFYVKADTSGKQSKPEKFNRKLNSKYHEGPLAFYNGGKAVVFTRNNFLGGKALRSKDDQVKLGLFFSTLEDNGKWTTPVAFEYNDPDYSLAHPSISPDNTRLYFSSDRSGGNGGNDIWICYWEEGKWSSPENLGNQVNTEGDEMFPFLADENTLYFASDGWGGFGGLDLFKATGNGQSFIYSQNMGFPMNSNFDDFSLVIDTAGRNGYYASDRPGGKGSDDIYAFSMKYYQVIGHLMEKYELTEIDSVEIELIDADNRAIRKIITGRDGYFHMDVPFDGEFELLYYKKGYTTGESVSISTLDRKPGTDSLDLFMWKHQLYAVGTVYDHNSEQPMPGIKIISHDLTASTTDTLVTDEEGRYRQLLEHRKNYELIATKPGYVSDSIVINTFQLIKGEIVNDFVLEEEYFEKEFIFFDFDKIEIKAEYHVNLDLIYQYLTSHPKTYLFIGAHADARGSVEYNQRLSEKRADQAAQYLISKGVKPDRITIKGFGELLILNRCADGVNCEEVEHSKNRRAEIKVEFNKPD